MRVAILGGGVAGLSAAHELVERGFDVDVYERNGDFGGKARSFGKPNSGTGGRPDLPGEHGFRFFPGFYRHVIDTMRRIPMGGHTAADNLVAARQAGYAQEGKPIFEFPLSTADSAHGLVEYLTAAGRDPKLGLTPAEALLFARKMLRFATSCDDRRNQQYELVTWWNFIDAGTQSHAYQKVFADGLTRSLVAMKAHEASTRTIGKILLQMIFDAMRGGAFDRILNAPTTQAWLDPWITYLRGTGRCTFHPGRVVDSFAFDGTQVTGVNVRTDAGNGQITADLYIAAMPVECTAEVLAKTPSMLNAAPSLKHLGALKVEWMNGIQFYLTRDVPIVNGHVIAIDSPWALTCISQAQFWSGVDLSQVGDGQVRGIISVDISDWNEPGKFIHRVAARDCATASEVAEECWEQLRAHFTATPWPLPPQAHDWFLDPAVVFTAREFRGLMTVSEWSQRMELALRLPHLNPMLAEALRTRNLEPLLINTCGSWCHRPDAATGIRNFFVAGDYVRTPTELACMEGANESARLAVNAILAATNSADPPCTVEALREPAYLDGAKLLDKIAYGEGLPPCAPEAA